ncbi:MAG TPA: selenium-dependent molybdenum cofactor biosynthesis protein YqeB [Ktedonobacteraceae bacterium]|nr:selenium-dependent molybdenum cofactor biosynthesis protein YqeB [Ktedonobacteraceae bacterium]
MNYSDVRIQQTLVAIKGAGDLATGVIHRLARAGFSVMATELANPTVVRRTVAFAEAVTLGEMTVEEVTARRAASVEEIWAALVEGLVPIVVDPDGVLLKEMQPAVLVEATLSKYNSSVSINDAPIVLALGPGYEAGKDVHAVIETNRGHNLGRVYLHGCAEPDTGVPGAIGGYTIERLLRAPCAGILYGVRHIGDLVQVGETVAVINTGDADAIPVTAAIPGILRGLVRDGLPVSNGMKVGDIDPRAAREHCFTISDKSRAVAGGVLEAILYLLNRRYMVNAQNRGLS